MSFEWAQKQLDKYTLDFDEIDKDKSGTLSLAEVEEVLKKQGFKGTDAELKAIFGQLDRRPDKSVSRKEFEDALKKLPRMTLREFALRKMFQQMDKDGNGKLTRKEILDASKKNEGDIDIPSDKISDLLIALIKDDDWQIRYDEFLEVFEFEEAATVFRQIFNSLDKDKSGFLTRGELMAAFKGETELKLSSDKAMDLLMELGRDDDFKINYQEFLDIWLKQPVARGGAAKESPF